MVFLNAIISTTIAYSWRDCGPSLVWSSSSGNKMSFNLLFAVCRRVLLGFQMLKGTWKGEYNSVLLKSTGFSSLILKHSLLLKCFYLLLCLWHWHLFLLFGFSVWDKEVIYNCFSLSVHEMISVYMMISKILHSTFSYIKHSKYTLYTIIILSCSTANSYYFLSIAIPNGFSYFCSTFSVTYDTFSSDILICSGFIDLYSVVDLSSPVSLWSFLIDVGA